MNVTQKHPCIIDTDKIIYEDDACYLVENYESKLRMIFNEMLVLSHEVTESKEQVFAYFRKKCKSYDKDYQYKLRFRVYQAGSELYYIFLTSHKIGELPHNIDFYPEISISDCPRLNFLGDVGYNVDENVALLKQLRFFENTYDYYK